MKIGGHGLRDHIRLLAPLFGLIGAVWLLRPVLAAVGAPMGMVRLCSVTLTGSIAMLVAVLLIHSKGFGSYPNVVLASFLLEVWTQSLISLAIAFSTLTGIPNVYSAPEFSGHLGQRMHIIGHMTFGIAAGTLFGSVMGCILLWTARRLVPTPRPAK